jgi:hypothetical protein
VDSFGYLIPKSGPLADSNTEDLLSVHLEISCPSAGSALSAYLEFGGSGTYSMKPPLRPVGHPARRMRRLSRSTFARPYIWRLSILIRLT